MKTVGEPGDPNLARVTEVARLLQPLRDAFVFAGGSVVGLLVTRARAGMIRATADVDVVTEVTSRQAYHVLEQRLREIGFENDSAPLAPICRFRDGELVLDVMPADASILGFSNRWYPAALETAEWARLAGSEFELRLISPAAFIATKLEAHASRGTDDMSMSHDLEDVVTVLDGRPRIVEELAVADRLLLEFVERVFSALLSNAEFLQAMPGFFPPDSASQQRVPRTLDKMERIATAAP